MNITININAPELANAIQTLAAALKGGLTPQNIVEGQIEVTPIASGQQFVPVQQFVQAQPVQPVAPIQAVPIANPVPVEQLQQAQPVAPVQPQAVPTSAPSYSMDQLAVAATQLVDAGKRENLVQLLGAFGVQALTALPKEQYGAFATKLREMGAQI